MMKIFINLLKTYLIRSLLSFKRFLKNPVTTLPLELFRLAAMSLIFSKTISQNVVFAFNLFY